MQPTDEPRQNDPNRLPSGASATSSAPVGREVAGTHEVIRGGPAYEERQTLEPGDDVVDVRAEGLPDKDDELTPSPRLAEHNIVAVFAAAPAARRVVKALRDADVPGESISLLVREDGVELSEDESAEGYAEHDIKWLKSAMKGGAVGGAAGGALGLAGALVVGAIPGVGPALAVGIFASVLGAGAAGATAGGMGGVFREVWDQVYRDALSEGHVIVLVATDEQAVASTALGLLEKEKPMRLDDFDRLGERVGQQSGTT